MVTTLWKSYCFILLSGPITIYKVQSAKLDEPPYPYPVNYVELQGGEDELSGNVFAVNSDGFFGPVCDDGWDINAATVVCRQLGYIEGLPWSWSHFGEVKPPVFSMDEMRCTGDEEHLQDCIYNNHDDYCDSDDAAGVVCSNASHPENYVELRGGSGKESGNVFAMSSRGFLGPVCDLSWDHHDADVVCRKLGYDWGTPTAGSSFGDVPPVFTMTSVNCTGDEGLLQDCPHDTPTHDGDPYPDGDCYLPWQGAGVTCHRGSNLMGHVELRGGNTSNAGNVWAMSREGYLGPICVNTWDEGVLDWENHEASVVCRQLGYSWGAATYSSFEDVEPSSFSMAAVECKGTEAKLQDCSYSTTFEEFYCSAAAVVCHNDPQPLSLELRGGNDRSGNVYAANYNGIFGPVCDSTGVPWHLWGKEEADVVCRHLGFDGGDPTIGSHFGDVEGEYSMSDVECYGTEEHLQECAYHLDTYNSGCQEEGEWGAGVICFFDSDRSDPES